MQTATQLTLDRGTDRLAVTVHPATTATPDAPFYVLVPAMGVPARYYGPLVDALLATGAGLAVTDLRGTGASTPIPSRAARYGMAELVDDVDAVLAATAEHRQGRATILFGHSLGGQISVLHLGRTAESPDVDGAVLVASGLPYWRLFGWSGPFVWSFAEFLNGVSAIAGAWPGWTFGGKQARGVIRDWAVTARRGRFAARLNAKPGLSRVTAPILAISVDSDQYTPSRTTDRLLSWVPNAKLTRRHLTHAEAGVRIDHFKWVKAPQAVVDHVTAWLPTP